MVQGRTCKSRGRRNDQESGDRQPVLERTQSAGVARDEANGIGACHGLYAVKTDRPQKVPKRTGFRAFQQADRNGQEQEYPPMSWRSAQQGAEQDGIRYPERRGEYARAGAGDMDRPRIRSNEKTDPQD